MRSLTTVALMAAEDETLTVRPIGAGVCVTVLDRYGDPVLQLDLSDRQANDLVAQLAQVLQ